MEESAFETTENLSEEVIYPAGKEIYTFGADANYGGMITRGEAFLESIDCDGNRRIIDIYENGDFFSGESLPVSKMESIRIVSKSSCGVIFFKDAEEALRRMGKYGESSLRAVRRLLMHVRILEEHNLRQKIMAFIEYEERNTSVTAIKISMSYSDMADFIGADRSAMMRELKQMCDEKIIRRNGRIIEILQQP